VLLVDDDESAYLLIRRLFSKVHGKKYNVEWASNYENGLQEILRHQHDIYLVDYRLGARTGLDLLREAVYLGAQAPIIILTGGADPKVDMEATKIGAADFLIKDRLDSETLERSVRYALQHYATMRSLQKSNERFRLLFERSLDAILISDDEGRILEANSASCTLLGCTHEELIDMKMSEVLRAGFGSKSDRLRDQSFGELCFTLPSGEHGYAEFSSYRFAPELNLNILRDITDRRRLENEIQEISEKEQRRLGQDLHDGLGQSITGISFLAKVLQQKLAARKAEETEGAANIVTLLQQALLQCREIARGLCPVVLESNDLHAALQQLSDNLEKYFGVASELRCDPRVKIEDNAVAVHLYRIAQEATTNAVKHGQAKKVTISLSQRNGQISLRVEDNGVGITKEKIKNKGIGLRVMQHRARMIGANVDFERDVRGGTIVTCTVDAETRKAKAHQEKEDRVTPLLAGSSRKH
jgi:signal transduction histidine kinase